MKKCTKCNHVQSLTMFNKHRGECKTCQSRYNHLYNKNHKDSLSIKKKIYTKEHKEERKDYYKSYRENNKLKRRKYSKKYQQEHKLERRIYLNHKYNTDIKFRLNSIISSSIRGSLTISKNGRRWEDMLGYTVEDLESHLKSTVTKDEWEEYKTTPGSFHIDHIKPKSLFIYESYDDNEFIKCWSLSNLQLLRAQENLIKSNKW